MAVGTRPRTQVQINLLPPEIRARQRTRRAFRFALVGAAAIGLVLASVTVMQHLQIAKEERTLLAHQAKAGALRNQVNELKEVDILAATADQTRGVLTLALANDVTWSRFLDDLDTVIPADSWVGNLNMSAKPGQTPLGEASFGTVQFDGSVTSFPGLSNWIDTMERLDGLSFVYLSNGNKTQAGEGGPEIVSFSASAHLTESILSGRCQKEGVPCP